VGEKDRRKSQEMTRDRPPARGQKKNQNQEEGDRKNLGNDSFDRNAVRSTGQTKAGQGERRTKEIREKTILEDIAEELRAVPTQKRRSKEKRRDRNPQKTKKSLFFKHKGFKHS